MRVRNSLAAGTLVGLAAVAFAVPLAASPAGAPGTQTGRTGKVILISLDTLRADHLGSYGNRRPSSPNLDSLAAGGVRFANCVATSPWTLPSHISMFTGLYPSRSGAVGPQVALREGVHTITEPLSQRGFSTAAVMSSDLVLPCERCRTGFDSVTYLEWRARPGAPGPGILDRGEEVTRLAIQWLEAHGSENFFLFLHYYDLHSDYSPEPEFARLVGADPRDLEPGSHLYLIERRDTGNVPAGDLEQSAALYDGEIREVDSLLGKLFRLVRDRGWWGETLVVVTADHGEEFLEHGGLLHGRKMYQELLHVPLIIAGAGLPEGKVIEGIVSLNDIAPTILAATGAAIPEGLDGHSLLGLARGEQSDQDRVVGAEADHFNRKRMVRQGNLKLILNRGGPPELYDLARDPKERNNLAEEKPDEVRRLGNVLGKMLRPLAKPAATKKRLSPRQRERLRALGYIK